MAHKSKEKVSNFAVRLKKWRKLKGWTQVEMAQEKGIKIGTLRNWEQGRRVPQSAALYDEVISDLLEAGELERQEEIEPTGQ